MKSGDEFKSLESMNASVEMLLDGSLPHEMRKQVLNGLCDNVCQLGAISALLYASKTGPKEWAKDLFAGLPSEEVARLLKDEKMSLAELVKSAPSDGRKLDLIKKIVLGGMDEGAEIVLGILKRQVNGRLAARVSIAENNRRAP